MSVYERSTRCKIKIFCSTAPNGVIYFLLSTPSMADRVQFNMERMAEELERYRKFEIFSPGELRDIIETRRRHEYRIQRSQKQLGDYLRYIKYEMDLEAKKEEAHRNKFVGNTNWSLAITHRIVRLFKEALGRFPADAMLFVQFVEYAMEKELYDDLKHFVAKYCLMNVGNVDVWIFCGSKLLETGDFNGARVLMQKGMRAHPANRKIKLEYFRMEVVYMEEMLKMNEEIGLSSADAGEVEEGALPYLVFCDLHGTDPGCYEVGEMLEVAAKHEKLYLRMKTHTDP